MKYLNLLVVVIVSGSMICGCGSDAKSVKFVSAADLGLSTTVGGSAREKMEEWLLSNDISMGFDEAQNIYICREYREFDLKGGKKSPAVFTLEDFEMRRSDAWRLAYEKAVESICIAKIKHDRGGLDSIIDRSQGDNDDELCQHFETSIFGVSVLHQEESFDAARGRYQVDIVVKWDNAVDTNYRKTLNYKIGDDCDSVKAWVNLQDFSQMIGSRIIRDKNGYMWAVGIATVAERSAMAKADLTAVKNATGTFGGLVKSKKTLTKTFVDGKLKKDFKREFSFSPVIREAKSVERYHLTVKSIFSGNETYVSVAVLPLQAL